MAMQKGMAEKSKSLGRMDIFKHKGTDCSCNGLSSRHDEVRVWSRWDKDAPDDAVVILEDVVMGRPRIRAVPANREGEWSMFGGCFVYTSNGAVPHSGVAVPLHDRFENRGGRDEV